ncbi:MAG: hypothetical protein P4M13_11455 [Alphaproteobacteria bacterium]|nr:hypothetical protein [Alphaproteobacteria bacterium]
MKLRLDAANTNNEPEANTATARSPRLLEWLARLTQPGLSLDHLPQPFDLQEKTSAAPIIKEPHIDDWNTIAHICGYAAKDFIDAGTTLPLTAAEIDYFRRNHRGTENHISRDFLTAQTDLPSPLAELYGLYRHRARIDAEATLFLAQSTHSLRVARMMADLLAVGAFANGLEYVGYLGVTYSVPCAFDTSAEIDRANAEAARRLALPVDHPSHLLKLTPDELGVLSASIAERNALTSADFLEKANLLSEARQDVNRLPNKEHFATAIIEHDLPLQTAWAARLAEAYARLFTGWVEKLPEIQALLN